MRSEIATAALSKLDDTIDAADHVCGRRKHQYPKNWSPRLLAGKNMVSKDTTPCVHDEEHEERKRERLDHQTGKQYVRAQLLARLICRRFKTTASSLYEECRDVANNKVLGNSFWFYPRVVSVHAVHDEMPVQYVIEGEVCSRR